MHCWFQEMGTAREIVNRVQKMRKKAGLQASDPVAIFVDVPPTNGALWGFRRPKAVAPFPSLRGALLRTCCDSPPADGRFRPCTPLFTDGNKHSNGWDFT